LPSLPSLLCFCLLDEAACLCVYYIDDSTGQLAEHSAGVLCMCRVKRERKEQKRLRLLASI